MLLAILYMQLCNHDAFEDSSEKCGVTRKNVHRGGCQTWEMRGHVRWVPHVCYTHAEGERAPTKNIHIYLWWVINESMGDTVHKT